MTANSTEKRNGAPQQLTPEIVFRDYAAQIYSLARRMMGNDADAEDVTQEVLLQVVRKLGTFRGDSAFSTWLHRVTVNTALAYRAKRAKRREREVADPLQDFHADGHHSGAVQKWNVQPDRQAINRETHELIEQAISEIPDIYRDVYVLADVEGMTNPEISEILGLSVPAVKSRLHRGRLLVRNALAPHFEETKA